MPIIKSAKKRVRQAQKAYERNKHYKTRMRTFVKKILKSKDASEAEKVLPEVYSAIDTAKKKNLIHRNKAARQKSLVARTVAKLKVSGSVSDTETEVKKKTPVKKSTAKSATKKTTTAKKNVKKTIVKKSEAKK